MHSPRRLLQRSIERLFSEWNEWRLARGHEGFE